MIRRALVLAALVLGLFASTALGGSCITKLSSCPNSELGYGAGQIAPLRTALLCLVNAARKAQGRPSLHPTRSPRGSRRRRRRRSHARAWAATAPR
ncbi:MAG TPA: hypothetical protein VHX88_10025 [Solirubrobacteraceae bacterium]|nr:hypothetical protein [Solirubrobacteraceae bacterium]